MLNFSVEGGSAILDDACSVCPTTAEVDLLVALAKARNVSAVSREVRSSRAAVKRHIARLERRLGVQLVVSLDERVQLTDVGLDVLTAAVHYRNTVLRLLTSAVQTESAPTGWGHMVHMAVTGRNWDEFVDDLAVRLPDVVVRLLNVLPAEAVAAFSQYSVDVVYGWQPPELWTGLNRHSVGYDVMREPMAVSLSIDHPLSSGADISLADLHDDSWIVRDDPAAQLLLREVCAEQGFVPMISHTVEFPSEVRLLLSRGEGVALVSPLTASSTVGSRFVTRLIREGVMRTHRLYVDPNVIPSEVAETMCDRLRHSYRSKALRRDPRLAARVDFLVTSPEQGTSEAEGRESESKARDALPRLEPEDLRLLMAIQASGSLNRAAPRLMISQPALTRRVSKLERQLGVVLLRRGWRGAALTPQAKRLLTTAGSACVDFAGAVKEITAGPRIPGSAPVRLPEPKAVR